MSMRTARHFAPRDARVLGVHCQHAAPSHSETSSFHRAFKRWTGNTAGRYRRTAASL